jgi:alpha-amylase
VFADGQMVKDYYSGKRARVIAGGVTFDSHDALALIGME